MANQQNEDIKQAAMETVMERRSFARFNREDWVKWINGLLNEEFCEPTVTIAHHEPCIVLANVYHQLELKSQRDLFGEAVKILFETTPLIKQNTRYFRAILELLALLKPYQAKTLLRSRLFSRDFADMEDGGMNLHNLLLIVNSKYEVDEQLLEFIERTAKETSDFSYLLICLRIVSPLGGGKYLPLLEDVLSRLTEWRNAILLARELEDIMYLHGSRHFAEWYSAKLRAMSKESDIFDAFEFLEGALKKIVFPQLDLYAPVENPFNTLIAAQLHANDRFYSAKEVVRIARLYRHTGRDVTVNALVNIWNRIKTKSLSGALPWYYQSYNSKFQRLPCQVSSGQSPDSSISEKFFEDEEPELAEIFEATKDAGCRVPEMAWRKRA